MTTVKDLEEAFSKFDNRRVRFATTELPWWAYESAKWKFSGPIKYYVSDYRLAVFADHTVTLELCFIPLDEIKSIENTKKDVTIKTEDHTYQFVRGKEWNA